jgi:hypothetical protein
MPTRNVAQRPTLFSTFLEVTKKSMDIPLLVAEMEYRFTHEEA